MDKVESIIADGRALFLDANKNKLVDGRKFLPGEIAVQIDMSRPVTLARLHDIATRFDIKHTIKIYDWTYHYPDWHKDAGKQIPKDVMDRIGDEGGYVTKKKDYHYDVKAKSFVIYQDGNPIYANDNGIVCRDTVALCDTLFD